MAFLGLNKKDKALVARAYLQAPQRPTQLGEQLGLNSEDVFILSFKWRLKGWLERCWPEGDQKNFNFWLQMTPGGATEFRKRYNL